MNETSSTTTTTTTTTATTTTTVSKNVYYKIKSRSTGHGKSGPLDGLIQIFSP